MSLSNAIETGALPETPGLAEQPPRRHVLDLDDFASSEISSVLDTAGAMSEVLRRDIKKVPTLRDRVIVTGIPQIKPTFLDIAPSGIPSNIIPYSKGGKCGLIRSNSPFSYSNHRPAKPKIPKPLLYAQVSPLGTSFATP